MTTDVAAELARLATEAEACRNCVLGGVRTQAVFGVGSPQADLMFVGEAPGYHEDQKGEPFVGAAGQLLTKLIEQKLGLKRSDVYIANVLKCRPPGNRDPQPDEVEACKPFLREQMELIRPRLVVALGNFAAKLLTKSSTGITRLRGKRYPFKYGTLMCTFHPAAALRGGAAAEGIAEDFEEIRRVLDEQAEAAPEAPGEQLDLFG
ncbi:MAG TPA: uracil-DNA glycosylase [Actinomycetota bacterium]|nr:uracil-DNA glycosylase [Actinomycetota bacterium]